MFQYLTIIKTVLVATALTLTLSMSAHAVKPDEDSAVSKNFKKVGRSFRGIRDAKTSADLIEILQTARAAMVANKDEIPSFMEAGTPELQEYIDGLDDTIGRVDKAIALAEADDFSGAMAQFDDVRGAKDEYHDKFELEDDH